MSILNLFSRLENLGINIQLVEKNLKIDAPEGKLSPGLIEEIKNKKQEIIRFLQEYVREKENNEWIEPAEKKEYYVLSSAQKRLYILQQMDKQGIRYNIPFGLELEGHIERHRLEHTFRRLVHRHESFRTSFEMKGDEPVQRVHEENYKLQITKIIKDFIKPFDLTRAPLIRVGLIDLGDNRYILVLDMHHIISDGTSIEILTKEFMNLHAEEAENLPALRIQYKDYAQWQNSNQRQTKIKKQEEYWIKDFGIHGEIPVLNLPLDYPRPPVQSFTGRELKFEISGRDTGALKKLAHEEEATLYMVLLSIYTIFLSKLGNREDIIVGTPIAGRRHDRLRNIIGMFVNTLALRNFPGEEMTFIQFLKEVKERTLTAFAHQDYPFEELVEAVAKERDTGRNPLFDTLFVLQNIDIPGIEIPGLSIKPYPVETGTSKFDLSLNALESERNLLFIFEYSSKLFRENTVKRFACYFKRIITSVVENKEIKLSQIEVIPEEEKKKILIDFNRTRIDYPGDKTIHRIFEEQVERTPDNIALVGPQIKYRTHMTYMTYISYRELNERSNRLAYLLKEKGVPADSIAAILVERSIEMIVALLGILKAGGAYLPIDTDYPQERIDYMLKDSGAKILLTDQEITALYSPQASLNLSEGRPFNSHHSSFIIHHSCYLAYIIYTSGTTGQPKGCMVSHQNVVSLLKNKTQVFDFNENDVWTMFHRYNFDFSVWEMYGALLYGGKLIIIPKQVTTNLESYLQILKCQGVTVLNQTPSAFYQLSGIEMSQPDNRLNLKYVIFGGEALSPAKLKRWKEKYPITKLVNMFGITETTIHVTYKEIGETEIESNTGNIGRPVPTLLTYVMDRNLNLQPIGIPGELCVAGEGVARGYLNNPELTSERFRSVFHRSYMSYRTYIYRSGDLARWLSNGDMEYLGRIDHQVKIRGFRIELGEIENQLLSHHEIKDAVVVLSKEKQEQPYLCAYFAADRNLAETGLRDYLSKRLPDYMIPAYFLQVDKIPLNFNGKIDKKALPEPGIKVKENYAAPRDDIERKLAAIWSEVLGCKSIGIDDNFFDIGGNSLNIIKVNKRVKEAFKKEAAVIEMFRYTTIRSLAQFLQQEEVTENYCPVLPPAARGAPGLDIAVIGMAGRFPGAKNIHEFWENLKNGVECTWFFTDRELKSSGVDRHLLKDPGYVNANTILEEIEYFDSNFFGYSHREAEIMDPQARMFHESAWNALEDAGYCPGTYEGLIGLYAGAMYNFDWDARVKLSGKAEVLGHFAAWQLMNKDFLNMWVSYKLNLKGPAVFVQTSCSTSLTAIHMACQALWNGECNMALAGGVSITLFEKTGYPYREGMILSPDGHCRAFDAKAKGTMSGNGVGIVVLKPLDAVVADGDHVYAVVKGSAVNNDGIRKVGFTAPSIEGQAEVIIAAQEIAKLEPESITYVETHGTGTPLGDPVEIEALKLAFHRGPESDKSGYCAIGSVKTNIGHLDAAAGVTGFIKAVLSIYHRLIPPSLHFENPNPKIDFKNSPFYVNTRLKEWKCDQYPLRAGVSSFGMGGTNAHVILEEAPLAGKSVGQWVSGSVSQGVNGQRTDGRGGSLCPPLKSRQFQLILLSAKTQSALDKMTENLAEYFKKNLLNPGNHENPTNPGPTLADAAYTLQVGRKVFKHRRMLVCSNSGEAVEQLSSPGPGKVHSFTGKETRRPVIFMFPGQGSQYVNMGLDLYRREPIFREEMDRCFEILDPLLGYKIKEILYPGISLSQVSRVSGGRPKDHMATRATSHEGCVETPLIGSPRRGVNQTEIAQPVLFSFEYALAKLLIKWGITPDAMIGYSIGEYVAACLSGVFSPEDALEVVVQRGKLMQQMPVGSMLGISLPENRLVPLLEAHGNGTVSLAAVNSSSLCTVSGSPGAVEALARQLKDGGIRYRRLHTSHAFHSGMMGPVLEKFAEKIRQVRLSPPQMPYISNLTGKLISREEAVDPGYWSAHLGKTVRFAHGLNRLLKKENACFVEVGPGNVLSTFVRKHKDKQTGHLIMNLVGHPQEDVRDDYFLVTQIGRLWLYNVPIDWKEYHAGEKRYRIPLPTYPFEPFHYPVVKSSFPGKKSKILLELRQGRRNDLDDWFYVPQWIRSLLPANANRKQDLLSSPWLVFMDDCGLGERLLDALEKEVKVIILVKKDNVFSKSLGPAKSMAGRHEYTLVPGKYEHYESLVQELQADGCIPGKIVHLWNITGDRACGLTRESFEDARELGFYSLIWLARAIGEPGTFSNRTFYIDVVTDNMQEVTGGEGYNPQKAVVLGPVQVIPREYPNIRCRGIDIDFPVPGQPGEQQAMERLVRELTLGWQDLGNQVIALRGNYRWLRTVEPVRLEKLPGMPACLKEKGVYLVTGGLGGMGLVLAEHLVRLVRARVILTGRSAFPVHSGWRQWLDTHGEADVTCRKIRKLQELETLGGEVMIFNADAGDEERMQSIIRHIIDRYGGIDGVIHAAGAADGKMIRNRTREDSDPVLLPKVKGTLLLASFLKDHPPAFLVLCSSLSSIRAPFGQVAYCSANAFLDAFAHYNNHKSNTMTISINWGTWQGVGMAAASVKQLAKTGQLSQLSLREEILPSEGVEVFDRILDSRLPQAAVSVRDLSPGTPGSPGPGWESNEYFTSFLSERVGQSAAQQRPELSTKYIEPADEVEQTLVEILQRFLGIDRMGIDDNLFELGVSSLDLVQISSQFKEVLKIEIPVVMMFKYSTARALAQYIRQEEQSAGEAAGKRAAPPGSGNDHEHEPGDLLQNSMDLLNPST